MLHRLSRNCEFKAVSAEQNRQDLVRDAFINGLHSSYIRQRLLENQSLTLDQAQEIARSLESAQMSAEQYSRSVDQTVAATQSLKIPDVDEIADSNQSTSSSRSSFSTSAAVSARKSCWFCGGSLHKRDSCPARNSKCRNCGKLGHWSKVCRSKNLTAAVSDTNNTNLCAVSAAAPACLTASTVPVLINGYKASALIDSASSNSFISSELVRLLRIRVAPSSNTITLAMQTKTVPIKGRCSVNIKVCGKMYKQTFLEVMDDLCCDVILGLDFQQQHKTVSFEFGGSLSILRVNPNGNVYDKVPGSDVCSLAVASLDEPRLFSNLKHPITPIATKSREYSRADKQFIAEETGKLLTEGVIEPSRSPWRAQVVVVKDEFDRRKKRLCVDFSNTINLFTELDAYPLPKIDTMINDLSKFSIFSTFDLKSAYYQVSIPDEDKPYTAFESNGKLYQFKRIPFGVKNGVAAFQRVLDKFVEEESLLNTFVYLDNITVGGKDQSEHDFHVKRFFDAAQRRNLTLNSAKSVLSTHQLSVLGYTVSSGQIRPDDERLRPLIGLPVPTNIKALKRVLGMFAYYAKWIPRFSDRVRNLNSATDFPLCKDAVEAFADLKNCLLNAVLYSPDFSKPFVVECDASDIAVSATLNQDGRPVAFMSRTLNSHERRYPAVEKEATAIIEAVRKWSHFLSCQTFTILTDQRSVAFMLDNTKRSKIKNDKIQSWRLELACFSYQIKYRPGSLNTAADALSRNVCAVSSYFSLEKLHSDLCHPGVVRLLHYVRSKHLPFSTDDVKNVCSNCRICAEIKPRFARIPSGQLVRATRPMERLSVDFKGPLPARTANRYMFVAIDEYSRFPFVVPCQDTSSATVISCLQKVFSFCGYPVYVHSDRGSSFLSREVANFLTMHGVSSSKTTPYHPQGNSQVERYNGIIWKAIKLYLKTKNMPETEWEKALPHVLSCIRQLLSTATNHSPHELFFSFDRRSPLGTSVPSWLLQPGPVFLKQHVRRTKDDPLVQEVELIHTNPSYAHIRYKDGRESSVSIRDLAPCPNLHPTICGERGVNNSSDEAPSPEPVSCGDQMNGEISTQPDSQVHDEGIIENNKSEVNPSEGCSTQIRRSSRVRREPRRYGW